MPDTPATTKTPAKTVEAVQAAPATRAMPRLGSTVQVKVPDGLRLINNDTGEHYEAGKPTSALVTVTTLRRLADGDLLEV